MLGQECSLSLRKGFPGEVWEGIWVKKASMVIATVAIIGVIVDFIADIGISFLKLVQFPTLIHWYIDISNDIYWLHQRQNLPPHLFLLIVLL